ncbi:hypothetical protein HPP92_009408 [Vanilla planifolia]|uniref:Uncharacterized protein n=1 Tax=Vanilla planifolia TaxID=51239 RepID=A0A835RBG1_VANPL|nr:hypothetical protein HPP92_009398 [Vanilla planifolia]KAG0487313.1 hypothetical protein HPP92_009408 [Vanilla planifolia]
MKKTNKILSMIRLGDYSASERLLADISLQLVEQLHGNGGNCGATKHFLWEMKYIIDRLVKLMEANVRAAMQFLFHMDLYIMHILLSATIFRSLNQMPDSRLPEPDAPS